MNEDIYVPQIPTKIGQPSGGPLRSLGAHIVDFIQTLVVFGAIFAIIYLFLAQPHKVSGSSMVPNYHDGDYILTDKVTYRLRAPKQGEVVVLKNPRNESQDFIKRIIAIPGDTIRVEDKSVFVNGQILKEKYLPLGTTTQPRSFLKESKEVKVEQGQYFVFGDNRSHSSDSREWGPITKEEIIGKVFFRYWPPNNLGFVEHSP